MCTIIRTIVHRVVKGAPNSLTALLTTIKDTFIDGTYPACRLVDVMSMVYVGVTREIECVHAQYGWAVKAPL